ncbi:hypothetical protein N6L27_16140 [Leisingera sp. SS27]|uniref:hypothetical protein n=1 Tax=unclassified Leisingera TaxID=2614906 RepID=UPI0021A8FD7B|nr:MULTISPECIES: hypothetical protein [unclassified Leisingera]MDC0659533.1 hypothetical protein [Leisingera sp. SS27]UWQ81703.1 hypothetical protein K3725_21680 [Leisingera sp. S132]
MITCADTLLVFASFSIRSGLLWKAEAYGRLGLTLFPEDDRIREMYAQALLLNQKFSEVSGVLAGAKRPSRNLSYVRARLEMLTDGSEASRSEAVRSFLKGGSA